MEARENVFVVHSLLREVYSDLRDQITQGAYTLGKKISVREMADVYGVSTLLVRKALNMLQSDGLVILDRKSYRVHQLTPKELIEIFMIRKNIEKLAMLWSYPNARMYGLVQLDNLVKEMDCKLHSPIEWNQLNKQFHLTLYSYSNSKPMIEHFKKIWDRVEPYMNLYYHSKDLLSLAQEDHYKMIECLTNNEMERFINLAVDHIQHTADAILTEMKLENSWMGVTDEVKDVF